MIKDKKYTKMEMTKKNEYKWDHWDFTSATGYQECLTNNNLQGIKNV